MSQALECSEFPRCAVPRRSWAARIGAWLAPGRSRSGLVQFDNPSRHLLRDIGLGEDRPGNPLLQDHYLRR